MVKARQNLIYIQKENTQLKTGGNSGDSFTERDTIVRQNHLEIPAIQVLLERTAMRMKEMNVAARQEKHTIAILKQKLEQLKQFRIAEQELEDCEAKINSLIMSSTDPRLGRIDMNETDLSSEAGSIGDDENVGIKSSVLKRETSPAGYNGRSQSPRATQQQRIFLESRSRTTMFTSHQVPVPSTPRQTEPVA